MKILYKNSKKFKYKINYKSEKLIDEKKDNK